VSSVSFVGSHFQNSFKHPPGCPHGLAFAGPFALGLVSSYSPTFPGLPPRLFQAGSVLHFLPSAFCPLRHPSTFPSLCPLRYPEFQARVSASSGSRVFFLSPPHPLLSFVPASSSPPQLDPTLFGCFPCLLSFLLCPPRFFFLSFAPNWLRPSQTRNARETPLLPLQPSHYLLRCLFSFFFCRFFGHSSGIGPSQFPELSRPFGPPFPFFFPQWSTCFPSSQHRFWRDHTTGRSFPSVSTGLFFRPFPSLLHNLATIGPPFEDPLASFLIFLTFS